MLNTRRTYGLLASAFLVAPLSAQTVSSPASTPTRIPTRSGEVILPTAVERQNYTDEGFAAIRRAGNLVFISGVIVGRRPGEGTDVESFKAQTRRTPGCRCGAATSWAGSVSIRPTICWSRTITLCSASVAIFPTSRQSTASSSVRAGRSSESRLMWSWWSRDNDRRSVDQCCYELPILRIEIHGRRQREKFGSGAFDPVAKRAACQERGRVWFTPAPDHAGRP